MGREETEENRVRPVLEYKLAKTSFIVVVIIIVNH